MKAKTAYFIGVIEAKLESLYTDMTMFQLYRTEKDFNRMRCRITEIQNLVSKIWGIENEGLYQMDMGEKINDGEDRTI